MALKQNVIYIYFKGKHSVTSKSQYQYNHGQFLYFADLDLPQTFEVHFSNTDEGYAKPQIGSNRLVEIPDPYFWTKSSQIYAWIYLHEGTTDGETKYEVIINLERRSEPVYEEILPTQQTTIERAIAELNNAVDVTTENANKTGEDRTQVSNIKDEIVDLKEDIDANAELATEKAQEAVNASLRSEASAQNAAEYESNAHNYSDEAKDYAQQALESKITASQKATIATDASVETLGYRDETLVAKNDVLNLKQDVIDYKNETKGYLDETKGVRADVQNIDNEVKDYASQAQASATSASQSATASANSASASANSASASAQIKADVEELERDAQAAANSSGISARASSEFASQAQGFANSASASAQSASGYASSAQGSANTASTKASEASTSAQTASTKASESAQSASQALGYKTDAESAKTASQTAQGLAESARDDAISAKNDAESARDDAESARDEAQQAVASISGALDDKADIITDTASGSIASFSDGADDLPLKSLVVDINPVQDLSNGDPSPENLCPISGWTEIGVEQRGKNIINVNSETWDKYNVSEWFWGRNAEQIVEMLNALKPGTYAFTFHEYVDVVNNTAPGTYGILFRRYVNGVQLDVDARLFNTAVATPKELSKSVTFTLTEDDVGTFAYVYLYAGFAIQQTQNSAKFYDLQIELGSTATPYEPYTGRSITIDLGQTVYGGKLDVLTGILTVYPYYDSYNGETLTGEWISDRDKYVAGTTPTIGAQVVNIGAQGVTVQLEPHEVESLHGVNNIWADSGNTEVVYRADTKAWVQRKIAEAISALS